MFALVFVIFDMEAVFSVLLGNEFQCWVYPLLSKLSFLWLLVYAWQKAGLKCIFREREKEEKDSIGIVLSLSLSFRYSTKQVPTPLFQLHQTTFRIRQTLKFMAPSI
jgi:hypothetical protein